MKPTLILGGVFIIIFTVFVPLPRDLAEYDTQRNGQLVNVTIAYIPSCMGTKERASMKFQYAGKRFYKRVGCKFGERHRVGEIIKLKHTQGTNIFLFEKENKEIEFVSMIVLALFGLFLIIYGMKIKGKTDKTVSFKNNFMWTQKSSA